MSSRCSLAAAAIVACAVAAAQGPAPARPAARHDGAAELHPFSPGEEMGFDVDFRRLRAARVRFLIGRAQGPVWPLILQGRSDGIVALFDVREHFVSYWDSATGLPRGSELNAIEIGDRHTDRTRFDRASGRASVQVIRGGRIVERSVRIPADVQDLLSSMMHLRGQRLEPGDRIEYPVFSGEYVFTVRAEVEGTEVLTTPAGRFDTVRVRAQLGFRTRFKPKGYSYVWLSNDVRHLPVRLTGSFAVGSVRATLVRYRPGEWPVTSRQE